MPAPDLGEKEKERAREWYMKLRKGRGIQEKRQAIKCRYALKFTALRREARFPMQSPTESTKLLGKDRKSENKFSAGAWNTKVLLSTVYQGREKGKADPKKLVKASGLIIIAAESFFRCPIKKNALS